MKEGIFILGLIKRAALDAGEIMLSAGRYSGSAAGKSGDRNYVTEYDLKIQRFLRERLSEVCPEAAFKAEEEGADRVSGRLEWIVDPIDGTSNFIHGTLCSAVSIALCGNGAPLYGAVFNPYSGELFSAARGEGAFLGEERISVSRRSYDRALISFGTTPYTRAKAELTFRILRLAYAQSLDIRRSGSAALDLCFLAAGRTDGFFEISLSPWDYAAGALLITEAGGRITDFSGNAPDLDSPDSIVAGNAEVYAQLLSYISQAAEAEK